MRAKFNRGNGSRDVADNSKFDCSRRSSVLNCWRVAMDESKIQRSRVHRAARLPRSFKDLTPAKHFNPRTFFQELV